MRNEAAGRIAGLNERVDIKLGNTAKELAVGYWNAICVEAAKSIQQVVLIARRPGWAIATVTGRGD